MRVEIVSYGRCSKRTPFTHRHHLVWWFGQDHWNWYWRTRARWFMTGTWQRHITIGENVWPWYLRDMLFDDLQALRRGYKGRLWLQGPQDRSST